MLKRAKRSGRILLLWIGAVAVSLLTFLFPHQETTVASFLSYVFQLLLFLLSIAIARHEPTRKNRLIFINFAVFFSSAILFHVYHFLGVSLLPDVPSLRFYFYQYFAMGGYFFLLAVAVVYLTIDALFREFRAVQKYILTFAIVGGFFAYYYAPLLANPRHLYETERVLNWKELSVRHAAFSEEHGTAPTVEDLAATTDLHFWRNGEQVGVLYPEERMRRVADLYPYLAGENYKILLVEPLYRNVVSMNVICVGFILLFFGYQYRKDPPQGAYIEKIMFFLLLFSSMEILHAWSFIKSVEWKAFYEMAGIGQHVSTAIVALIGAFFALRLHFIRTVNGEFYETEIVTRPGGITRWRDWLDDFLIAQFFNRRALLGRLFVGPPGPADE